MQGDMLPLPQCIRRGLGTSSSSPSLVWTQNKRTKSWSCPPPTPQGWAKGDTQHLVLALSVPIYIDGNIQGMLPEA